MGNVISFMGRLGGDPELKQVGQNDLLSFSCASDVGWGDKKSTNWFRCTVWGKRATSLQSHLSKGSKVWINGEMTIKSFANKEGVEKTSVEVNVRDLEFAGGKDENQPGGGGAQQSSQPSQSQGSSDDASEDMPF
jgi:single-strand DNA-binding protein